VLVEDHVLNIVADVYCKDAARLNDEVDVGSQTPTMIT
jgi:hypothetical protein